MKYKHWKRWILTNSLFVIGLALGWFTNYSWAMYPKNVITFVTWLMLALGIAMLAVVLILVVAVKKFKTENQKSLAVDIAKIDSVPLKLDMALDAAIILAFAAAGSFVLATAYLIAQTTMHIGKNVLKELQKEIVKNHPVVQEEIEKLEPPKKINCTELDI